MRKSAVISVALFLTFGSTVLAQTPSATEERPPATKLEAFQAKTGTVLIRGFTTVGRISGRIGGGYVSVDARDFREARNPKAREAGIAIEVGESGRLERQNTSFIDADEIESLLAGI